MSEPTGEQQKAIESNDLDILVEAGAGSGKTRTTVDRYKRLVREVDPSGILVFTFTEKAATELRERIRKLRADSHLDFSMGSVWIGTFHSICSRILRAHSIAAGVDPSFDVLDDVQADRLKQLAWERALTETMKLPEADLTLARYSNYTLREGIQDAYEQLRAAGQASPKLSPAPPAPDIRSDLRDLREQIPALLEAKGVNVNHREKLGVLIAYLDSLDGKEPSYQDLKDACFFSEAKALIDFSDQMDRICRKVAEAEFGGPIRELLGSLLKFYGQAYRDLKERRGLLDFEDLQLEALELLESHPAIAGRYREQFSEIMVDEFQDTNRLQMSLIEALRGPETRLFTVGDEMQAIYRFRHADVELFRHRRQGLDPLPLSANFRSEAPVIGAVNLIGHALDRDVSTIRKPDDGSATSHEFKDLRVGLNPDDSYDPGVEFLLTQSGVWREADLGELSPAPPDDAEGSDSEGQHEAEALALAHHIREAIDQGVPPGEIVILTRVKARMWLFAEALKQVGVRPYVVGGAGFWESREGVDLRSLLRVIANPLDDDSLIGTLAGPACGISTDALWLLGQRPDRKRPIWPRVGAAIRGELPEIDARDIEKLAEFSGLLSGLRDRLPGLPLAELVDFAVTGSGYDLVSLRRDPSGAGMANIRRIAEIAAEFEGSEGRDLRGFVEWIDASRRLDSEAAVATEDEESDTVRLMTIHKSKGLEFGMVCVADLGKRKRSESEKVFWISPGDRIEDFRFGLRVPKPEGGNIDLYDWKDLSSQASLDSTDEELRLFHVAMTRAERRLVLSGLVNLEKPPSSTENSSIADRLARSLDFDDPELSEVRVPAADHLEGVRPPTASAARILRVLPDRAEQLRQGHELATLDFTNGEGSPPLLRPHLAAYPEVPLSYSALAEYRACPSRFFAKRVLRLDDPNSGESRNRIQLDPGLAPAEPVDPTAFGLAVHAQLEQLPGRRWRPPTDQGIAGILEGEGVEPTAETLGLARSMIDGFLGSELAAELEGHRADPEVRLLVDVDGVIIRGFADLLVRDLETPMILDYKTNRLDGKDPRELMEEYDLQRDLYALAVSEALGAARVETVFAFLRAPADPVRDRFDAERLAEARTGISRLVEAITQGRYFGGPDAVHQPCGGCWACDLLRDRIGDIPDREDSPR